jgi:hypothetical protein
VTQKQQQRGRGLTDDNATDDADGNSNDVMLVQLEHDDRRKVSVVGGKRENTREGQE